MEELVGIVVVLGGIIWVIGAILGAISKGVSSVSTSLQGSTDFRQKRDAKYATRVIDYSKTLLERNADIIEIFKGKIKANAPSTSSYSSYGRYGRRNYSSAPAGNYYIENETRDCLNEIALAENSFRLYPDKEYLSIWKPKAPKDWQDLASKIETDFRYKQQEIKEQEARLKAKQQAEEDERAEKAKKLRQEQWEQEKTMQETERNVKRYMAEFNKAKNDKADPSLLKKIQRRKEKGDLLIEDIPLILGTDLHPWSELEAEIIAKPHQTKPFPLFSSPKEADFKLASIFVLNQEITKFNDSLKKDAQAGSDVRSFFKKIRTGYENKQKEDVIERFNFVINSINIPASIPQIWDTDFDPEEGILIVEIKLPDIVHNQVLKEVALKHGKVKKPITLKEQKEIVPNIHPATMLRFAYEIFRNDSVDVIKLLVLNGWVEFDDPSTGNLTRTYTASLAVTKEQIMDLKLSKLDPIAAFSGLKGKSAGRIVDIIPIEPTLSLNRKDKRFVEAKEILSKLGTETNLASMDWQDFEHLIREMFEKEFSGRGAEVKITQASRDKGVDAVVFDPDPIHGGKYVIQAKRYTNTVDVSAVRDLCAVVRKEGASRGILVTTSTYGADAYAFAQNEPVTLLNGAELLGLLKKHGYTFRINLQEARKLHLANGIKPNK